MWWLLILMLQVTPAGPERSEVESWLGRYQAGPESIAFLWEDGLVYHHGHIAIPADGEWHVTVPEFYVRHRVSWLAKRRVILLEESHDASPPWRHELRFDNERIVKVSLSGGPEGGEIVVRTFEKRPAE